jgi:dTDP-glucose 4,6-dehydratase
MGLSRTDEHLPVNVGNPSDWTVVDCARAVLRVTGSKSRIVHQALPQDDPVQRQPDISKSRRLFGWEPKIDLETGLSLCLEYLCGCVEACD